MSVPYHCFPCFYYCCPLSAPILAPAQSQSQSQSQEQRDASNVSSSSASSSSAAAAAETAPQAAAVAVIVTPAVSEEEWNAINELREKQLQEQEAAAGNPIDHSSVQSIDRPPIVRTERKKQSGIGIRAKEVTRETPITFDEALRFFQAQDFKEIKVLTLLCLPLLKSCPSSLSQPRIVVHDFRELSWFRQTKVQPLLRFS